MQEPLPPQAAPLEGWKQRTTIFLASQGLSMFGSMLVQYAIIWYLTLETRSGWVLTLSTLAGFLPQIAITVFAGVWADRYPRKRLIIFADLLTATSTLFLAVAFLLGYRDLWLILLVSAIRSVGGGIQAPAVGALLPQLAPEEKLIRVNSINGTLQPLIMLLSPVVAGGMLAAARLEYLFFIDVITAALAVGLLLALKVPPMPRSDSAAPTGYLADLRAGLTYVRDSRAIRSLFLFFAFTMFLVVPAAFLSPLLVARTYGEEVWKLTANEITFFSGSVIGGFIMTAWGGFPNRFRTLGFACLLWAGFFTALGLANNFTVYLVFMFLSGLPMPVWMASATTLLQELVPPTMQGRVFGLQGLIGNTVMPLGMVIFGPLADRVSIELLLVISSALMAIPGVWIFFQRTASAKQPCPDGPPCPDLPMVPAD